jgi:adenylyl-sulfate kinase
MGRVLWFTGLSGSGKTTIAELVQKDLELSGKRVKVFDGDVVRTTLHKHLGFSPGDIKENNRLISELCLKHLKDYDYILVPIISPFRESRQKARELLKKDFIEVYTNCHLEKCIERDVKGHYKKALAGEIKNFIGIDKENPYEPPEKPEITLYTFKETPKESAEKILKFLGSDVL